MVQRMCMALPAVSLLLSFFVQTGWSSPSISPPVLPQVLKEPARTTGGRQWRPKVPATQHHTSSTPTHQQDFLGRAVVAFLEGPFFPRGTLEERTLLTKLAAVQFLERTQHEQLMTESFKTSKASARIQTQILAELLKTIFEDSGGFLNPLPNGPEERIGAVFEKLREKMVEEYEIPFAHDWLLTSS